MLKNLEVLKLLVLCFWGSEFCYFGKISAFKMCKNSKELNFNASKWFKMVDLALLESQKMISSKMWVVEKLWNFHFMGKLISRKIKYETSQIFTKWVGNTVLTPIYSHSTFFFRAISRYILPPLKATSELWAFYWAVPLLYWRLRIKKAKLAFMWRPLVAILKWYKSYWVKDQISLAQTR